MFGTMDQRPLRLVIFITFLDFTSKEVTNITLTLLKGILMISDISDGCLLSNLLIIIQTFTLTKKLRN